MGNIICGIVMISAGVVLGLYVGVYLMLIGGIVQIVAAVKGGFIASGIAWGVVKIVFASAAGGLSATLLMVPGYYKLMK